METFGTAPGSRNVRERGQALLVLGKTLDPAERHMLAHSGQPQKNLGQGASPGGHTTGRESRLADDEILPCQFRWRRTGAVPHKIFS